jgi:hypothetical protein
MAKLEDSLNREVEVEALVHLDPPTQHLRWRVVSIDPMVEPNVPPGMVKLVAVAKVTMAYFQAGAGHNQGLTRIATADEVAAIDAERHEKSTIVKPN